MERQPKVVAGFCPFALCNKEGLRRTLDRYAEDPASGVEALVLEYLAVALNPRQGLANGVRLAALMAADPRQRDGLRLFEERLAAMGWRLYEVRRARRGPRCGARSLRAVASGDRAAMEVLLHRLAQAARERGAAWEGSGHGGISRLWIRRRGDGYPHAEHYLVAAPAGAADKTGPGFAAAWQAAQAAPTGWLW